MVRTSFAIGSFLLILGQISSLSLDRHNLGKSTAAVGSNSNNNNEAPLMSRRSLGQKMAALSLSVAGLSPSLLVLAPKPAGAAESLADLKATVQKARAQLDPVPAIIEKQQWDKVRAILITPPLSDFWTTTKKGSNILMNVASAVGDAGGDEFNILELREETQSHLRYLDMAVYNNVFNPIATEGTAGATKELVRSYYEDPKNELKACQAALDGILAEMSSTGQ